MKKKAIPFTPFFYEVKVHNLEICRIDVWDFATDGQELVEVVCRLKAKYPAPAYKVKTQVCERVVKS